MTKRSIEQILNADDATDEEIIEAHKHFRSRMIQTDEWEVLEADMVLFLSNNFERIMQLVVAGNEVINGGR